MIPRYWIGVLLKVDSVIRGSLLFFGKSSKNTFNYDL